MFRIAVSAESSSRAGSKASDAYRSEIQIVGLGRGQTLGSEFDLLKLR